MTLETLSPTDPFWERHRGLYPALGRYTYLNNAAIQPLPAPVAEALHEFIRAASEDDPDALYRPDVPSRLRATYARWLGCEAKDLALTTSTSDGLIKAVNAVRWREGDEILIPQNEFPSVVYPFKMARMHGARILFAGEPGRPVTEEDLLAAVTPKTRAAAFSWVSFSTGYKLDLSTLSRALKERGVELVFVDGMQGAGVWPPRLAQSAVDFFAFQAVKWIAGPNGAGALYVRPDLWSDLDNPCLSWYSVPCCDDYSLLMDTQLEPFSSARRWDGGTPPWIPMVGVQAYLDLLEPAGPEGVAARAVHVMALLAQRLESAGIGTLVPLSSSSASSIALLELPDAASMHQRLKDAGILTSLRMGRIRVSPHVYNGAEDFDRLVAVLTGSGSACEIS
jgi:selenocysteine lyase/cysteine desulfurase